MPPHGDPTRACRPINTPVSAQPASVHPMIIAAPPIAVACDHLFRYISVLCILKDSPTALSTRVKNNHERALADSFPLPVALALHRVFANMTTSYGHRPFFVGVLETLGRCPCSHPFKDWFR